jgi:nicotinic acid phosphoribosyltransferase
VRKVLDESGCASAKIVASGDLNEYKIAALARRTRRSISTASGRIW